MKRYNIYYKKYSIIARDYIPHIKVIYTNDIYHEIGKVICNSLEEIKNIRYTEPRASIEECEQLWKEEGYHEISKGNWIKTTI